MSVVTYHTRLRLAPDQSASFDAYAERYGRDSRRLNRLLDAGVAVKDAKRGFVREGLTARQFNAMSMDVRGRRAAREESRRREIKDKERAAAAIVSRLADGSYSPSSAHQKRRRLASLRSKIARLESGRAQMTFGSRRLWGAQRSLLENGYADHASWLWDWRSSRSSEFLLVGSKDERMGNQSCQWNPATGRMAVRLPDELGKFAVLEGVRFPHGGDVLAAAIASGVAVTYRFVRRKRGWYVQATTERPDAKVRTDLRAGALGVDIGPGLVAVTEADAWGNPVSRRTLRLPLCGKSTNQSKAMIADMAVEVVDWADRTGKPLVVERLDFSAKRAELRERGRGYARMLSAFAYAKINAALRSRAAKAGVGVIDVSPVHSSTIGVFKYAAMHGMSSDEAAALVLGRRGMGYRELAPPGDAPGRPEDRSGHAWGKWRRLGKALRLVGRHAFAAARRGPGGGKRIYPSLPARAAPAPVGARPARGKTLGHRVGLPEPTAGTTVRPASVA